MLVDRMGGGIVSPQVVYIDDNQVKWIVSENDITTTETLFKLNTQHNSVKVSLKEQLVRRKASNE